MNSQLDYGPLRQSVSIADLAGHFRQLPKSQKIALLIAACVDIFFIIMALIAVPSLVTSLQDTDEGRFTTDFVWVFIGTIAVVLLFGYIHSQRETVRLRQFALLNSLTYYSGPLEGPRSGLLFQQGDEKYFQYLFGFSKGSIAEFGDYQYDTGSGRDRTTHYYGFVHVKLPRRLPNMVLDSRQNNILGATGLPGSLRKDQILHLEGDFDNYFTLYAPKEYEQDALYIFTPDVMRAMVDAENHYDGEIVDDDFYLYTKRLDMQNVDSIEELLSVANRITGQLDKQASQYKDERVEATPATQGTIAVPGARLQLSTISRSIIVVIAVLFAYWIIWLVYSH